MGGGRYSVVLVEVRESWARTSRLSHTQKKDLSGESSFRNTKRLNSDKGGC